MQVFSYTESRDSSKETEFLLSSPKNAERLRESLKEMREEKGQGHGLIEP